MSTLSTVVLLGFANWLATTIIVESVIFEDVRRLTSAENREVSALWGLG